LREIERCLFYAVSQYRRSLDLMIASASAWAHITLYYGSWFASNALLHMHGCSVFSNPARVVDVKTAKPGKQELQVGKANSSYRGSHRKYWDLFYRAMNSLKPLVDQKFSVVLTPISGDPVWQIDQRNQINYDTFRSLSISKDFKTNFDGDKFPSCLHGTLNTQFTILELLLELSFSLASNYSLKTDALDFFNNTTSLKSKIKKYIYREKSSGLIRKTKKSKIL